MHISIISFTPQGGEVARQIVEKLSGCDVIQVQNPGEGVREWVKRQFEQHRALIFVGACGIAVRFIAPLLKDKLSDPPVLVIDELGRFVIPILSGHMGGANELASLTAACLEAVPVITTATDLQGKFAVDLFAKKNGITILNKEGIAAVSSKVLRGEKIKVSLAEEIEMSRPPEWMEVIPRRSGQKADILIDFDSETKKEALLYLKPRRLVLGFGCKKGKSGEELERFARNSLSGLGLGFADVAAIASIERKKEETGLVELAKKHGIPFMVFTKEELRAVDGSFSGSKFVEQTVGVDNVCERAAMAACTMGGRLLLSKQAENGMTIAIAEKKVQLIWE